LLSAVPFCFVMGARTQSGYFSRKALAAGQSPFMAA
jgi:hypothetical protein